MPLQPVNSDVGPQSLKFRFLELFGFVFNTCSFGPQFIAQQVYRFVAIGSLLKSVCRFPAGRVIQTESQSFGIHSFLFGVYTQASLSGILYSNFVEGSPHRFGDNSEVTP